MAAPHNTEDPERSAISICTVLEGVARELDELSRISAEVESDVGTWLGLVLSDMEEDSRGKAIRRLQRLDALTQTLLDLSALTRTLALDAKGDANGDALAASARLERIARLAVVQKTKDRAVQHGISGDLTLF